MEIKRLDENGNVTQEFYEYAWMCYRHDIEVWVDIKKYEGLYQISNFGRVKSLKRISNHKLYGSMHISEKIMSQYLNDAGYNIVTLFKNGIHKKERVHRLVGIHFIPNPKNKQEINHKTGNKSDSSIIELEWNTPSENMKHSYSSGLRTPALIEKTGYNCKNSKEVFQYDINMNFINKYGSTAEAARIINCSQGNISRCANGFYNSYRNYIWRYSLV